MSVIIRVRTAGRVYLKMDANSQTSRARAIFKLVRVRAGGVIPPLHVPPIHLPKWRLCPACLESHRYNRGHKVATLINVRLYFVCEHCIDRDSSDPCDEAYAAFYGGCYP